MNWILDTFIAAFILSFSYICIKYAAINDSKKYNSNIFERSFIIVSLTLGILAILLLIFVKKTRNEIIQDFQRFDIMKWLILGGILVFISYFFLFRGSINSPNLGYARALLTIDIIILTILSSLLFGSNISFISIVGMILILSGVLVISYENKK